MKRLHQVAAVVVAAEAEEVAAVGLPDKNLCRRQKTSAVNLP